MKRLLEKAMNEGALGISTGLVYNPGRFSKLDELASLAQVAGSYGGLYATHMRDEALQVFEALQEALTIGRKAGAPVHVSHLKIMSKQLHGQSAKLLAMIDEARAQGVDVTADMYAYTASSTDIKSFLPEWATEGSPQKLADRLQDPQIRSKAAEDILRRKRDESELEDLSYAVIVKFDAMPEWNGLNLVQAAEKCRKDRSWNSQIETILDIITSGGAEMVFHGMDESDVEAIARHPMVMFASDATVQVPDKTFCHPRAYGNNARILEEYVSKKRLLTLEEAVRKMTSFPARRFHLPRRGALAENMAADLVVFDLKKVKAPADYRDPHRYAEGFPYVMVNGTLVIDDGQLTRKRPGKFLKCTPQKAP